MIKVLNKLSLGYNKQHSLSIYIILFTIFHHCKQTSFFAILGDLCLDMHEFYYDPSNGIVSLASSIRLCLIITTLSFV